MAEHKTDKILEQPLPQILNDLQANIDRVEELALQVQQALVEAKEAAAQAKESGEKAATEARIAADKAVAKAREDFSGQISKLQTEIAQLREEIANESLGTIEGFQAAGRTKAAKSRLVHVDA